MSTGRAATLVLWVLVGSGVVSGEVLAQPAVSGAVDEASEALPEPARPSTDQERLDQIFRAAWCYYDLNYDCVVSMLGGYPSWYARTESGALPPELNRQGLATVLGAGRFLAVSYLALGEGVAADRVFHWLLALEPTFLLGGSEVAPSFVGRFLRVRAEVEGPTRAVRAIGMAEDVVAAVDAAAVAGMVRVRAHDFRPPPPPRPAPVVVLRAHTGVRVVAMTGAARRVYADGVGFDVSLDVGRDDSSWIFGAEVAYSVHDVRLDNLVDGREDTLEVLHLSGRGGYEWRLGWLGLRPDALLSLTSFGLARVSGKIGLSVGLGVLANAYLGPQLVVGVGAVERTLGITDGSTLLASTTLEGRAVIGARF